MRGFSALFTAAALAIVITALTLNDRRTPEVINALAQGTSRVIEASLGQH